MRAERTIEEVLIDKAVTLALLSRVSAHISDGRNHAAIGDRLKLQKLTFLTEYPMFQKRIKGMNFTYFTYRWGPFTKDLYEVETDFIEAKLMSHKGQEFTLTPKGADIGKALFEAMQSDSDNAVICEAIEKTATKYAKWTTEELVHHTHKMKVRPVGWTESVVFDDLPHYLDLTRILDEDESIATVEIDPAHLDQLGYILSKSAW